MRRIAPQKAWFWVHGFAGVGAALCFIVAGFAMVYCIALAAEFDEARQKAEEQASTNP